MDGQNVENLSTVRASLVECSAAGDCTAEVAAMPSLALASNLPLRVRFAACVRDNGLEFCMHKLERAIDITEIQLGGATEKQQWEKVRLLKMKVAKLEAIQLEARQ